MNKQQYVLYKHAWVYRGDFEKERELSSKEISMLLKRGGLFVRNVYNFDCKEETSFWHIIKDTFGGMDELSSRTRNKVRRALKTLRIVRISKYDLLNGLGYNIYKKACSNYKVKSDFATQEQFENGIKNYSDDYDYWGVYDIENNKLVGFSINLLGDKYCDYSTFKADPDYLKHYYPFYGLIYKMNEYYLGECKYDFVDDGARSISEHSNIQPFLMDYFGFRKAYCKINITYKWWVKIVVNLLYPFRKYLTKSKIQYVLNMEAMNRGEL